MWKYTNYLSYNLSKYILNFKNYNLFKNNLKFYNNFKNYTFIRHYKSKTNFLKFKNVLYLFVIAIQKQNFYKKFIKCDEMVILFLNIKHNKYRMKTIIK